jgi:CDP-diacylglycerol--glycerol-3-phosphate 3-phosphatidyltransferase
MSVMRVLITAVTGILLVTVGPLPYLTFFLAIAVGVALLTDFFDGKLSRHLGATSRFGQWLDTSSDVLPRIFLHTAYVSLGWMHPLFMMILLAREFTAWAMRLMVVDMRVEVNAGSALIGKVKTWAIGIGDFLTILLYSHNMREIVSSNTTVWIVGTIYSIACLLSIISMTEYAKKWAPGIWQKHLDERRRQRQTKLTT